jgi:hypothetical protein
MHSLLNFSSLSWLEIFYANKSCFGTPFHLTRPPNTDLDALPDPNLAKTESSFSSRMFPNSPFKAVAKHARPEAEEAMPDAVGNELTDLI